MKNFLLLLILSLLCVAANGQAVSWELSAQPGDQVSNLATFQSPNFANCTLSRGAGITAATGAGSMNASGWFSGSSSTTLADAIANNDYYEITCNTINCLFFNLNTIKVVLRSSATGPNTATLRCSSDGFASDLSTVTVGTTSVLQSFPENLSPNSQSVTYRLYGYGGAAGGGNPGSGGTMRVGTSVVASDNDIEFFGSTTLVAVSSVSNITVNDGDAVPSTVFTANVPGATINWTRTPESIGLNATSGTGNVPAFTALNASGIPVTSTFTVNATVVNCQSANMIFTITVNPPACDILSVNFLGNPSSCSDNGTPNDPSDDFFTQNLQANFINRPVTGNLQIVPGGDQIGIYSIPVSQIIGNSHIFNAVKFKADGTPTVVTMNFTDDPACSETKTGPTIQACSTPATCSVNSINLQNVGSCNDNGTSNPADDYFTADVKVTFTSPPATGNMEIELPGDVVPGGGATSIPVANLVAGQHIFTGVRFKADGTTTVIEVDFTADQGCVRTATASAVSPCSFTPPVLTCPLVVAVSCANEVPAVNPGSVSAAHTCPGNVTITHIGDVNSNVVCINKLTITRTYQGTDQCGKTSTCSQTITINDQTPPTVTCPSPLTLSCASQVPAVDVSLLGVTDNCTGGIGISRSFVGEVTSNSTCANRFTLTRTYKGGDACGNTATCTQIITVSDQTAPSLTCPAAQTVSCASQVPAQNTLLVTGLSDNCGGSTPTVSFINEVISNQTCTNRFTLTRQYRAADACGNTSSCTQIITVNDQTPPVFTSVPANVTVDCYLVPGVGIATASDNCTSGTTVTFVGETSVPGICPIWKILTRTWRATDACGNSATASQVVTVTDFNAPQFLVLPKNQVVECGPNNAAEFQAFLDNRGGAVVEDCTQITDSHEDAPFQSNYFDCGNTFHKNIRFFATDECGNVSFRDASFTVVDQTPPVFSTPPQSIDLECDASNDNGENAFYDWLDSNAGLVAEDNCGAVALEKIQVSEYAGCGNTWRKTYEFRAKDECGNLSKTTATFAVVDHTPPTLACPPNDNIFLPCLEAVPAADPSALSAYDCSGVTITLKDSWTNGTGCPNWPMTVAYRYAATDGCGNEAVCERAFYVKETDAPTLVCPDTIKLVCVNDIPGPAQLFNTIKNQLVGNCAGGFSSITILGDSGQPQNGATQRTYTFKARNHCGKLSSACSVTFKATGTCNQLCTASQASWGDPSGTIGGMTTANALQTLLAQHGPVTVGGANHIVSAADPACVQELLFGSGTIGFLPTGNNTCPLPASLANGDGSLNNQLAANAMALQLNIWYNQAFNSRNLGGQNLHNLPPCLIDFAFLKDMGPNSTVNDLLFLTNQYLQGFVGNHTADYPAILNEALDNLNYFRVDCGLNAPCERPAHGRSASEMVSSDHYRVFPNPTTGKAMLEFWAENEGSAVLKIADLRGKLREQKLEFVKGSNKVDLDLTDLPSGVYLLTLQSNSILETHCLVKIDNR